MPFLALDLGTSSVKVVLCNDQGQILSSATAEYPLHQPHPGWSEQHPDDWWNASANAIRRTLASAATVLSVPQADIAASIHAVGLSGQMHGSVFLDAHAPASGGRASPLRPAILWNDQRTGPQCEAIQSILGGRRACVEQLGNAPLPGFTLPKLMWVREHEPDTWRRVRHLLLPKDFIRFRLTGELATDVGDAGGVLLFDLHQRSWNTQVAEKLGIDPAVLPAVYESCAVTGQITPHAAAETGLAPGTPVVAGSGDNQCAAAGSGIVSPGQVLAVLGTSGVMYAHCEIPTPDLGEPPGRLQTFCAPDGNAAAPGQWCSTGCMLSAAGALAWCRSVIAPEVPFDVLMHEAESAPPGCDGLLFLPYLTGERCPHPDPAARGGWIGLTARHTRAHLVRAVLEGVTFGMGQMLDLMRTAGVRVERIGLSGGGNRSALWRQIQADVYGVPVCSTEGDESGSALGAALLAGVGIARWPSLAAAAAESVRMTEMRDPQSPEAYANVRAVYAGVYARLREVFIELACG
ncbi:MAG: xylulokinase [Phycisphaeraceae bacterium]|nr:xylulokinase [Phycisphaeraceae bacterium]MCW5753953.1 xylulokinase [Phycisphaeraceae bacterium]